MLRKSYAALWMAILSLVLSACNSVNKSEAIAYNDKIVDGLHTVDQAFFEYMESAGSFSPELMQKKADTLQIMAALASQSIQNLPDLPEGVELQSATLDYLAYIQGPGKKRIDGILAMIGTGITDSSGAVIAVLDLRHDTLMKDTDDLFNRISIAQEEFAEEFGFDLEE